MKKYIAFLLVCVLALAGCANTGGETNGDTATKNYFEATILKISDTYVLVEPAEGTPESKSADQIMVSTRDIEQAQSLEYLAGAEVGDSVGIGYRGGIAESYPAQINAAYEIKLVTKAEALNDKAPMIRVDGELYYDTGKETTITARCGVMDGEITSTVGRTQTPAEDNQSNFGTGYGYQFVPDDQIEVYINNKWIIFERRPAI